MFSYKTDVLWLFIKLVLRVSLQGWLTICCCLNGTSCAAWTEGTVEECLTVRDKARWESKVSRLPLVERRLAEASRHQSADALVMALLVLTAGVLNALFGT